MSTTLHWSVFQVTCKESFHRRLECEQEVISSSLCSVEAEALVEELAFSGEPLPSVLKLLCLLSVVSNGIRAKTLQHLQNELTHAYGFDRLALTWPSLARLGLLKKADGRAWWTPLKKGLKLVVDNMPDHKLEEDPSDLAYVYAGYAPLSVRLIHAMLSRSSNIEDLLRTLPGPHSSVVQGPVLLPFAPLTNHENFMNNRATAVHQESRPPVTLICFVGGCTYSEVAAIRWLGRNACPRREYVVLTTSMITGDAIMESLVSRCRSSHSYTPG